MRSDPLSTVFGWLMGAWLLWVPVVVWHRYELHRDLVAIKALAERGAPVFGTDEEVADLRIRARRVMDQKRGCERHDWRVGLTGVCGKIRELQHATLADID